MGPILLKKAFPHLVAILTFLLLNIAYFYPQMEGKVLPSGDTVAGEAMSKELVDLRAIGEDPMWTNSMFGGMPAYQLSAAYSGNKMVWLEKIFWLGMSAPIGYFNALMIIFYLMMVVLGVNPWLSMIGAIAFGFSSNHFVLFEAGHYTKLRAIAQFMPVIAGSILLFRKKYLMGGALFTAGLAAGIRANHIQMTYYLGIILSIYVLVEIVRHIKNNQLPDLIKIGAIFALGVILSVGTATTNLWTTYEYSKDTMRGDPILTKAANETAKTSSEVEGLEWNYAMQWSNGFMDVMATMIPGVVGGGSGESIKPTSATAIAMRKRGAQVQQAPLYWGTLPFTSGPVYVGAIMCFLFVLGLLTLKGPMKWWIAIGVLLTFLLSMGKNFEVLNRLFFDYFPMYSKFRAPSSITSISSLLIPLLGILGLSTILKGGIDKGTAAKNVFIAAGITGGISLFIALVGPSVFDFASAGDASYQQRGYDIDAIISDRQSLMRSDAFRSFALIAIAAGLIWAQVQGKINQLILLGGIGLMVVFDMWSVGRRYVGPENFVNATRKNHPIRPVDQQIFAAEKINPEASTANPIGRGGYRVLDLSINTFNSANTSYYHNTIGGYHPAKLQRFQDIIDYQIMNNNQGVLNMLNTKYIINREGSLQQNPGALGPVWFVENIKSVNTPNEAMEALNNLNPATDAVVLTTEFGEYINGFDPQKNGTIQMTNYQPHKLKYTSNSTSEQLAVFSEIWYGEHKGWQAYIDGQAVEHIRANYLLRALKIPAGSHTIEFKFDPKAIKTGETISLVSSSLVLLALFGLLGFQLKEYIHQLKTNPPVEPIPTKPNKPVAKTVSRRKQNKKKK